MVKKISNFWGWTKSQLAYIKKLYLVVWREELFWMSPYMAGCKCSILHFNGFKDFNGCKHMRIYTRLYAGIIPTDMPEHNICHSFPLLQPFINIVCSFFTPSCRKIFKNDRNYAQTNSYYIIFCLVLVGHMEIRNSSASIYF